MTTKTLNRPTAQLSVIPPGHWRCKWTRDPTQMYTWRIADVGHLIPGTIVIDDDTWISPPRFLTRERANEDGRKYATEHVSYVEAVYFDGEAP